MFLKICEDHGMVGFLRTRTPDIRHWRVTMGGVEAVRAGEALWACEETDLTVI
jgi:hypothetical protein